MTSTGNQREINWDIDVNPSIFCTDQLPPIADFPCMSSSSSSSSNPAPAVTTSTASSMSSSSSSAASWAVLQTEGDGPDGDIIPMRSTMATNGSCSIDCMDVMDLIDGNEMWDPSSIFEQNPPDLQLESEVVQGGEMKDNNGGGGGLNELGAMFFEWLKSNKEFISAEDMKKIKLKKSTVECASKRLGSSQEGKKQLLKLILEWVQQHQLQRKNSDSVELLHTAANTNPATLYPSEPLHGLTPQAATTPPTFSNGLISPQPWIPPYPPYMVDHASNGMAMVAAAPAFSYMGGGYDSGLHSQMNPYNNTGSGDYQALESAPSWNPPQITMAASPYHNQFPDVCNNYAPHVMPLAPSYTSQFSYNMAVNYAAGGGDKQRLMRLGTSATKEARKKRMARQRRTYFHHHHHSRHSQNNQHSRVVNTDHHPQAMLADDTCSGKSHVGNWLYWPSTPSTTTLPSPPPQMEGPCRPSSKAHQSSDHLSKQISSDKLQGLNTEKNLKFLLQKVLKQSDVGSLGRIVMPKKEAESHLPDLASRDGITIPMEDIGTSQVWNMRYRFWPNNKSRMYLLENTGDFVKANGLQEGDFIVLYSNVKCGKYLIRGVKVRQPVSAKSEGKKPVKRSYQSTS